MTWHGWHIGWMVAWELVGLAAALSLFWAILRGPNRRRRIEGEMGDPRT